MKRERRTDELFFPLVFFDEGFLYGERDLTQHKNVVIIPWYWFCVVDEGKKHFFYFPKASEKFR